MKTLNFALRLLLIAFTAIFLVSFFNKDRLVEISNIDNAVKVDPIQTTAVRTLPFSFNVDGNNYIATPLYDYEISGVVVSKHDYSPDEGSLSKPIRYDLCMVWGGNVTDKTYLSPDISFSQNNRFCNYNYSRSVSFNAKEISNNHLVTADESVLKVIESIDAGDEVVITGMLINLSAFSDQPDVASKTWNSSTTREDTGAGACEVIYVQSISVLMSVHAFNKNLNKYSSWGILIILVIFVIEIIAVIIFIKPKIRNAGGFIQQDNNDL